MMILITPSDFHKLSLACQYELLKVFTAGGHASQVGMNESDLSGFYGDEHGGGANLSPLSDGEPITALRPKGATKPHRNSGKQIVEISVDQARRLIANISPLSQKTLKQFVFGDLIMVDSLIGSGKDYQDLSALKKSFVGGVKRRLRTVTGNRDAVLFVSNQDRTSMYIRSESAEALRQAFNLPPAQSSSGIDDDSSGCFDGMMPPESH